MKKQKKAYKIVIDYIKQQIRNRELMIGELLPPERELSEKLGVSRNSIREALKILSVIGVISSRQGAGNYVSCDFDHYLVDTFSMMFILGELDYDQINQIRIGLEMQAYALAVKYADNSEILQMQEYVEKLDRIHYAIAKASRNVLIQNILNALSEVMDVFIEDMRREILRTEERKEMLQEFHKQMVEYLIKRDAKNGQKALMQHFEMIDQIIHEEMKI